MSATDARASPMGSRPGSWPARPDVVVTGMGIVTSLGVGVAANWDAMLAGRSGIRPIERFPTEGLRTTIAGAVELDPPPQHPSDRSFRLGEMAVREALEEAMCDGRPATHGPAALFVAEPPAEAAWSDLFALHDRHADRREDQHEDGRADRREGQHAGRDEGQDGESGTVYGRILAGLRRRPDGAFHARTRNGGVASRLAARFGTAGVPVTVSTACAAGATALQLGAEAIRRGETQMAICVGADGSLEIETLVRFSLLSALSTRNEEPAAASRPFSAGRDGFVMAEGAGALVLESADGAARRGATVLARLLGCGERADGTHRTRSAPDGAPAAEAIHRCLRDAGVGPDAIGAVNAHGTSTPENDRVEHLAIAAALGDAARTVPVSSSKSMIGHTLSAAGAVEAVASCLTLRHGVVPPTINLQRDPDIDLDVVSTARDGPVRTVLSNSFGFGGQNVCLLFGAA